MSDPSQPKATLEAIARAGTALWTPPSPAQWQQSAQILYRRADVAETELLRWVDTHAAPSSIGLGSTAIGSPLTAATSYVQTELSDGNGMQRLALAVERERSVSAAARVETLQVLNAMLRKAKAYPATIQDASRRLEQGLAQLAAEAQALESVPHEAQVLLASLEQERSCDAATLASSRAAARSATTTTSEPQRRTANDGDTSGGRREGGGCDGISQRLASFLATNGGTTFGWADDDHRTFLRSIMNSSGKATLEILEELLEALPQYTREELTLHLQRYAAYMGFVEQKRVALAAYREQKEADAANEHEVQEIRKKLLHTQAQSEAMVKEQKRLKHHQSLHRKLSEWNAKKQQSLHIEESSRRGGDGREEQQLGGAASPSTSCWQSTVVKPQHSRQSTRVAEAAAARQEGPDAAPLPPRRATRASDLQKRHEADMERVAQRRGRIELVHAKATTTRADITASIAERLQERSRRAGSSSSVSACRDPERLTRLTESAASRLASHVDPTAASMGSGGGTAAALRDTPMYLTPRNAQGTHRASASWCSKTYQRL